MEELSGKRVTVVGLGRTAMAAIDLLLAKGATPFVTDSAPRETLTAYCEALDDMKVAYETGGHTEAAFEPCDCVVLSPGVPNDLDVLAAVRARGVPVTGEAALAWPYVAAPVLAVTGTNGKTTTTEWLAAMVRAAGREVVLAGNNGTPLSEAVLAERQPDCFVVEMSSYQLERAGGFRPFVGAVLNLTPDHLGRHGTMEAYAAAKAMLFANMRVGDTAVVNADDEIVRDMQTPEGVRRCSFSVRGVVEDGVWIEDLRLRDDEGPLLKVSDMPLPGEHNLANALAALTVARAAGMPREAMIEGLTTFTGVEHRIEYVATIEGARYYNDSKSTNLDSLRVALESFEYPIVLIAGGRGKGEPYDALCDLVRDRVKVLIAIGEDGPVMTDVFSDVPSTTVDDMASAVRQARVAAGPEETVLLSPGCASFDWYANFGERGADFKAHVRALAEQVEQGG